MTKSSESVATPARPTQNEIWDYCVENVMVFTSEELKNIQKKSIWRMSHIFKYTRRLDSGSGGLNHFLKNDDTPYIFNLRYLIMYYYVNGYTQLGVGDTLMDLGKEQFNEIDLL